MDHTNDVHIARSQTAFIALVCAVFACSAKLVDDPRLSVEGLDDAGMGMIYYERYFIHDISEIQRLNAFLWLQGTHSPLHQPRFRAGGACAVLCSLIIVLVLS